MKHGEMNFVRLKRRADFLRVAKTSRRYAAAGLVLQTAPRPGQEIGQVIDPVIDPVVKQADGALGIGFTASKKVGNAVARNRAKRRLRALAADVMPSQALPNRDYVLIGRAATLQRPYADLRRDLLKALAKTKGLARELTRDMTAGQAGA